MELMPNCAISLTYCFQNIRKRSGTENVRPMSITNFPNVVSALYNNLMIIIGCKGTKKIKIKDEK